MGEGDGLVGRGRREVAGGDVEEEMRRRLGLGGGEEEMREYFSHPLDLINGRDDVTI
jgi:hypothetical protein